VNADSTRRIARNVKPQRDTVTMLDAVNVTRLARRCVWYARRPLTGLLATGSDAVLCQPDWINPGCDE